MDSAADIPKGMGFPIRKSPDQRLLPSPRSLSQGATSFIASRYQGIHQMPFFRLRTKDNSLTQGQARRSKNRLNSQRNNHGGPLKSRCPENPHPGLTTPARRPFSMSPFFKKGPGGSNNMPEGTSPECQKPLHCVQQRKQHIQDHQALPRWWSRTESNRRPPACKAGALPTELRPLVAIP